MVTVGIDPHKHVHVAGAVDPAGRQLGKPLTVKNSPLLISALLAWIRSLDDASPVTWAIEDGHGFARRLADGLLLTGHEVVWVPTRLMMAHRKLHPRPAPSPTPSMRPPLRMPPSPPPDYSATASTSACANCASSWIIARIWSSAEPQSSTKPRPSSTHC